MNNNFLQILKENLSVKRIDFLSYIPKEILIDKKGQALYFKMEGLNINYISNFIYNIINNEVILIIPFITINNTIKDPYISLSPQFLLCKNSDPVLIYKYLSEQLNKAYEDYRIDHEDLTFNLYFKHKRVNLSHKEF